MFLEQSFSVSDIPSVITLAFLELLLSADNAIVLGLVSHSLPVHLRRKALYLGVVSAFFFRAAALISVSYLLHFIWIQLLGAAYLLFLSIRHLVKGKSHSLTSSRISAFWKAILLIEFFDLAFAVDSIVAGVAFIGPTSQAVHPKLWIVYLGGMLGLIGTRTAADLFSSLIDRFPKLEISAYLMIGWIGIELALNALKWNYPYQNVFFWIVIVLFFLFGFWKESKGRNV